MNPIYLLTKTGEDKRGNTGESQARTLPWPRGIGGKNLAPPETEQGFAKPRRNASKWGGKKDLFELKKGKKPEAVGGPGEGGKQEKFPSNGGHKDKERMCQCPQIQM